MKLQELIDELGKYSDFAPVVGELDGKLHQVVRLDSYRGYYEQLSLVIDRADPPRAWTDNGWPSLANVGELRARLQAALGEVFEGYKGGDYTMHDGTPLWVAEYGSTGGHVVEVIEKDGAVVVRAFEVDQW